MAKQAVVVGDLQVGITRAHPFAGELVPRAAALAAIARERGNLVVLVHTALRVSGADVSPRNAAAEAIFGMGDAFHEGSPGVALDPGLGVQPDDVVVTRRRASSFAGTDLDTLLVAGVATSAMVAATLYAAADLDLRVRLAVDVCADPDPAVHDVLVGTLFPGRGVDLVM